MTAHAHGPKFKSASIELKPGTKGKLGALSTMVTLVLKLDVEHWHM